MSEGAGDMQPREGRLLGSVAGLDLAWLIRLVSGGLTGQNEHSAGGCEEAASNEWKTCPSIP